MEARLPKKVFLDVAAENSSGDSLSFAGLVCIHDQHSKSPATNGASANQINKQDPEFEFSCATPDLTTNDPNKNSPADLMISNSQVTQVQLQAFLIQSKQPRVSRQARGGSKKSSDNNPGCMEVSDKPKQEERNQANKKRTAPSSWFGRKIFQSFVSPCRKCHAVEPSNKAQMVPAENVKSH